MSKEQEKALDYDHFALEYFAPLYPFVAGKAVGRSGIRSGRLLDIGCAGGHQGLAVMEKGDFHGTFCDINTESLKLAEKRLQERNLKGRTVACDVQDMPFEKSLSIWSSAAVPCLSGRIRKKPSKRSGGSCLRTGGPTSEWATEAQS